MRTTTRLPSGRPTAVRTGTYAFVEESSEDLGLVVQTARGALVPDGEESRFSEVNVLRGSHRESTRFVSF